MPALESNLQAGQDAFLSWLLNTCDSWRLLLLLAATWACCVLYLIGRIRRVGLLGLLPGQLASKCHRPPFEILNEVLDTVILFASNLLRILMLACMDLTEEQRMLTLQGLTSDFYRNLFERPLLEQLPAPVRRLMLGQSAGLQGILDKEDLDERRQHAVLCEKPGALLLGSNACKTGEDKDPRYRKDAELLQLRHCDSRCCRSAEEALKELGDLVTKIRSENSSTGALMALLRVFQDKMAESTYSVHTGMAFILQKQALGNAKRLALDTKGIASKAIVSRKFKTTAASAVGGAVVLGASGSATGMVAGACTGAAMGLIPAVFTFGLSIPVGAVLGACTGMCVGAGVGGSAGFVGGGAAGYYAASNYDAAPPAPKTEPEDDSAVGHAAAASQIPADGYLTPPPFSSSMDRISANVSLTPPPSSQTSRSEARQRNLSRGKSGGGSHLNRCQPDAAGG